MVVTVVLTVLVECADKDDIANEVLVEQCARHDVEVESDEETLIIDITNEVVTPDNINQSANMGLECVE